MTEPDAFRHYCRNPRCRSKLPAPVRICARPSAHGDVTPSSIANAVLPVSSRWSGISATASLAQRVMPQVSAGNVCVRRGGMIGGAAVPQSPSGHWSIALRLRGRYCCSS